MTAPSEGGDPLPSIRDWGGPCTAKSVVWNQGSLRPTPYHPQLGQTFLPASNQLADRPGSWRAHTQIPASLPKGPSLHQGQCLTRMSPLDSCRQCRASSWLVPAPGKMLEQAAVSRSSTGEGGEKGTFRAGLGRAAWGGA